MMLKDTRCAPWCTFLYVAPSNAAFLSGEKMLAFAPRAGNPKMA